MLMNQALIFLPVLALVVLTFAGLVNLAKARAAVAKQVNPGFYRAHQGEPEPEAAAAAARHWDNLFELPTLFYAACLVAYVLGGVGTWTLVFAWLYVAARTVQSVVHMTSNAIGLRAIAFLVGCLFAFLLWINVGITIFGAV